MFANILVSVGIGKLGSYLKNLFFCKEINFTNYYLGYILKRNYGTDSFKTIR